MPMLWGWLHVCLLLAPESLVTTPPLSTGAWEDFISAHDPIWERMPESWWEAPYLGNGLLGTMLLQRGDRVAAWQVGRSDVEDHRPIPYGMGRLPIGSFEFRTAGVITGCALRQDLLRAEISGEIQTTGGRVQFEAIAHALRPVLQIRWKAEGEEAGISPVWVPREAIHPRYVVHRATRPDFPLLKEWLPNPPGQAGQVDGVQVWKQGLAEGGYATAWTLDTDSDWHTLWVSIAYAWPGVLETIGAEAAAVVRDAQAEPKTAFSQAHRDWWRSYYAESFFSVSDRYWESFYWNQLYKLASATRAGSPLLDLQGPWDQETPWPGTWWNLNVQLTYWPMYTGNRLALAQPLARSLKEHLPQLIANVEPEFQHDSAGIYRSSTTRLAGGVFYPSKVGVPGRGEAEIGNLLWACHNLWLHYRMSLDEELLRETLFPVLRRAVNYHRHFLTEGADGRLHLPETRSPEYKSGPDCNYDLSLLRWGVETLLRINGLLALDDPLAPAWQDIAARLAAFPEDAAQGFLIAREVPLDSSHRHYSHLLMVYPLHLVNPEQQDGAERIRRSLQHWHSFPDALFGYSFTGGASMAALLGDGELALSYLTGFKRFIEPNTMYREAGPVIETPLSAMQSIHDLLLQSWDAPDGPLIRIFPAVPQSWQDVVFDQWRAEGAFLVSAARHRSQTSWVRVHSLAGSPCRVRVRFSGPPAVSGALTTVAFDGADRYVLPLKAGESVVLRDPAFNAPATVAGGVSTPGAPVFGLRHAEGATD